MVIRRIREDLGWSQERLAESVGVGAAMLGRYERGAKFPSYVTLVKLARVLEVSTDRLLGLDQKQRAPRASAPTTVPSLDRLPPQLREAMELVARELTSKTGFARKRVRKSPAAAEPRKPAPKPKTRRARTAK